MGNLVVLNHPMVDDWMCIMRDKSTEAAPFREAVERISELLALEAVKTFPVVESRVETPVTYTTGKRLQPHALCLVPVLRAGLGMVEGMLRWLPFASVRHVGLARDEETLKPSVYLTKLSAKLQGAHVLVIDPMLATGGTAVETVRLVKAAGAGSIQFLGIIGVPEGVQALQAAHPDVDIFLGAMDERLNEKGYIVPGLGDAGDRLFGTL